MKKRVASRRSEAGSGEHRSAGPPPSESVRAGAGMAAGRGGLQFGEAPGREGRKPSQKAVGSWASSPGGPRLTSSVASGRSHLFSAPLFPQL